MEKYKIYWKCGDKEIPPFEIETDDLTQVVKLAQEKVNQECESKGVEGEITRIEKVER